MTAILSLGSNLGDRYARLEQALAALDTRGARLVRVSPVVETPALLPADAPSDWNRPFLNLVVECTWDDSPEDLLSLVKRIETDLGRGPAPRWSPRPIDIDIALLDDLELAMPKLSIPHPGMTQRAFVLAPLAAIAPWRPIPGSGLTALGAYRRITPIPLWMGIVNLTPDSFSDGGRHADRAAVDTTIDGMCAAGAAYVDLGAESTRPGATPLTADDEWSRLAPMLEHTIARIGSRRVRPKVSVDTYHPAVARRAIEAGADAINDVSGLTDPAMIELAAGSPVEFIAMHQVSLPADPARTLATNRSAVDQVDEWLDGRLAAWSRAGIGRDRIVFDPGVGFGKTPLQSLELLRGIDAFVRDDLRVLVGHSRKSFLGAIRPGFAADRDLMTIGASLELASRGVDILRVHDVGAHTEAMRGFTHARPD